MRSADESETSKVVPKSEGRPEKLQGEAGVISMQSDSGISVPVQSIANFTTALIRSAIPLTVLQNGLSLSAPLMVTQSTFQNASPSLLEFKGQAAQILPNDLGLHLVTTDRSFKPPVVIGLPAGTVGNSSVAMPIKMETNDDDFSETDDESSSNQEWASPGSALHSDESAVDYSVNAPNYTSASSTAGAKTSTKKMKTSSGSRRNCKDVKLTPEEEERRKQRRERNKLAAAKCRQKRVDQTNQLLAETQVLEEEQSRLEEEIKKYQQQKEELEFVLEAHRLHCGLGKQQSASLAPSTAPALTQNPPPVASLPIEIQPIVKPEVTVETTKELKPQMAATTQGHRVVTIMQRPTSFPVASRSLAPGASMLEQALGIPMSTPSSGIVITLGLDSMLDGHTGLTPITGVPSIVAQTPQNPPSDAVPSSSDTLNPASTALMSL